MQPRERKDTRGKGPQRPDKDGRKKRRKVCQFCANKNLPDYKAIEQLRRFITERGKIQTMRSSGCCATHQRALAKAIKRARQIGFLPFTAE